MTQADALEANEPQDGDVVENPGMPAEDIDMAFVPTPLSSVTAREFDGELVLLDLESGAMHVLNQTSGVVWRCFDGEVSLGELVVELAEAFSVPEETVATDILSLTQTLGSVGLLQGVAAAEPQIEAGPEGLEVGEELTPFRLRAVGGGEFDLASLRGHKVLLVNWSPSCSFCDTIAPMLAETAPLLAERDVELVLLSFDSDEENREMLDEHGLKTRVALQPEDEDDSEAALAYVHPFPGMGTPVAYLLDEDGLVAEPLAYGAVEVPLLARRMAGLSVQMMSDQRGSSDGDASGGVDQAEEEQLDSRYIQMPASAGVCAPSSGGSGGVSKSTPRTWEPTVAYRVGRYHVGIRADSPETEAFLARAFAPYRVEDDRDAPPNFSVVMPSLSGSTRGLNLLMYGNTAIVRTRSPRRLLQALPNYLYNLAEQPLEPGLLEVSSIPALAGGRAVLIPANAIASWLDEVQPRVARAGVHLVDVPKAIIDPATAELVVPEPPMRVDPDVLAELPEMPPRPTEGPSIPPGRYPLAVWTLWEPDLFHEVTPTGKGHEGHGHGGGPSQTEDVPFDEAEEDEEDLALPLSRAEAAAAALWLVAGEGKPEDHLETLARLFQRVAAVAVFGFGGDDFSVNLKGQLAHLMPEVAHSSPAS